MKSKMSKLAAAAAIVIAVLLGLQVLDSPSFSKVTFAQAIQPILTADTAVLDLIIGADEEGVPVIHDMVMGSRIRRTMSNVADSVSIIDLEAGRILTLSEAKKEAAYINLEGLPSMPNYMEHLRNVIVGLQESPHFVVEDLDSKEIDGREAVGFLAKNPKMEITLWADADTGLPVRIDHRAGQMLVIAKNLQFDVPMEESLFSMDVPEGYTQQEVELDLFSATEEDFIEGLRILAETFGQGQFPDSVALEDYVKQAGDLTKKFEALGLSDEEETELGGKLQKYVLFVRFFHHGKGQGKWYYRGNGVRLGEAEVPIFWYRPTGSETYRVIYGDLRVEEVAVEDLPEPLDPDDTTEASAGNQQSSQPDFVGRQEDHWQFLADGRVRVKAYLTLLKGPADTSLMPIRLPYPNVPLEAVLHDGRPLTFHRTGQGAYTVELPADRLAAGETLILCQWHLSIADLRQVEYGYRATLRALVPVASYKLKVGLDEESGLEFTEPMKSHLDPSQSWVTPFTWEAKDEPTARFGSCAIMVQRRN